MTSMTNHTISNDNMQFCGISFILLLFLKASLCLCFTAPPVDDCSSDADCENNDNGKTVCDTGVSDKCKGKFTITQPY